MTTAGLDAYLATAPGRCAHGYAEMQHPRFCQCAHVPARKAAGIAAANDHAAVDVKARLDAAISRMAATGHGPHDVATAPTTVLVLGSEKWPEEHEEPLPKALVAQRRVLNDLAHAT